MTWTMADENYTTKAKWKYNFELPLMDARTSPVHLPPGHCAWISGVDGRHTTTLRPFPGFTEIYDMSGVDPDYFRCLTIAKGSTGHALRGFVCRSTAGVRFYYYDTESGSPKVFLIDSNHSDAMSVVTSGKFIYYARAGKQPRTIFWDDTGSGAMRNYAMGWVKNPSAPELDPNKAPTAPAITINGDPNYASGTGGFTYTTGSPELVDDPASLLEEPWARYTASSEAAYGYPSFWGFAYRYYDSRRDGVFGMMSDVSVAQGVSDDFNIVDEDVVTRQSEESRWWNVTMTIARRSDFDSIQIFRTARMGSSVEAQNGVLFHEKTIDSSHGGTISCGYRNLTAGKTAATAEQWDDWYGLVATEPAGLDDDGLLRMPHCDPTSEEASSPPQGSCIVSMDRYTAMSDDYDQWPHGVRWSHLIGAHPEAYPASNYHRPAEARSPIRRLLASKDMFHIFGDGGIWRAFKASPTAMRINKLLEGWSLVGPNAVCQVDPYLMAVCGRGIIRINVDTGAIETFGILDRIMTSTDHWAENLDDVSMAYDALMPCVFILCPDLKQTACIWPSTGTVSMLEDTAFKLCDSGPLPEEGGPDRAMFVTDAGKVMVADVGRTESNIRTYASPGGWTDQVMKVKGWPIGASGGVDMFRRIKTASMAAWITDLKKDYSEASVTYQIYRHGEDDPVVESEQDVSSIPSENWVELSASGEVLIPGVEITAGPMDFELSGWIVYGERTDSGKDRT